MTDEVPPQEPTTSEPSAAVPAAPVPPTYVVPEGPAGLTKAQKLEAKAARLREQEAARAAAGPASVSTKALIPWAITVGVLVLALIASVLYAVHENSRANSADRAAAGARSSASSAAQHEALESSALKTAHIVAASFGTYDYQTLTADFARTRAYLTPSFAADFAKLTSTLGSLITQAKGQTVGTVQDAGVESISDTTAIVIVFLDQKVTSADSTTPRIDHNRLRLTLARQTNGTWLVSKLELI